MHNAIERGQRYYARYLEVCARRNVVPDLSAAAFSVGAEGRYERYANRYRKGPNQQAATGYGGVGFYGTGQNGPRPGNGQNCCWYQDQIGGGRPYCNPRPARCDCHVIGGTTLNNTVGQGPGIPANGFGTLQLDSGDADTMYPYYMSIVAFERVDDNQIDNADQRIVLLTDSKSGQQANMRRASDTDPSFGAHALVYGELKELECVDWNPFSSTNRQELTLTFFNPTSEAVHVFVNIWGTMTQYGCGPACPPNGNGNGATYRAS